MFVVQHNCPCAFCDDLGTQFILAENHSKGIGWIVVCRGGLDKHYRQAKAQFTAANSFQISRFIPQSWQIDD